MSITLRGGLFPVNRTVPEMLPAVAGSTLKYDGGGGASSFFALSAAGGFELLQPVRRNARTRLKIRIVCCFIVIRSFCIDPDMMMPGAAVVLTAFSV
jgi:hypothetical protein